MKSMMCRRVKKNLNQQKKKMGLIGHSNIHKFRQRNKKNSQFGKYAYILGLGRMKIRTNLLKVNFGCQ